MLSSEALRVASRMDQFARDEMGEEKVLWKSAARHGGKKMEGRRKTKR